MELSKQVTNLELSERLRELGVPQDSLFYWVNGDEGFDWVCVYSDGYEWNEWPEYSKYSAKASAYTVAELGELLPQCFVTQRRSNGEWECGQNYTKQLDGLGTKFNFASIPTVFFEQTEVNARAKMLIWLIENKYINFAQNEQKV